MSYCCLGMLPTACVRYHGDTKLAKLPSSRSRQLHKICVLKLKLPQDSLDSDGNNVIDDALALRPTDEALRSSPSLKLYESEFVDALARAARID